MIPYSRDPKQIIPTSAVKIIGLGGAGAATLTAFAAMAVGLAVQACVATYKGALWALDGNLCYATLHDRANDIHPGGLSPL